MYAQTDRPMQLTTPLGKDKLLPTELRGREGISELFQFNIEAIAELGNEVQFDKILGQKVALTITPKTGTRYFSGIVKRFTVGGRSEESIHYHMEVVPQFWFLTKTSRCRIFQQMSTPDILKKVLTGMDVTYELQGQFRPREYVVQYQETDFNFASRLMEDEGIYYFFKHTADGHKMVLANTPSSHPPLPYVPTVRYEHTFGHSPEEDRVFDWLKSQEIRTGKYTVWDEHFQLPYKHLDADKTIQESVTAGKSTHKLKAGGADKYEIYEFPGGYSRIFDGINKAGGDQSDHLQWIFEENRGTVEVRMQQEAVGGLLVDARSGHAAITAGHTLELTDHFTDDGKYVLTSVEHEARQPMGWEGGKTEWKYVNRFNCIPIALPYRPQRSIPPPSVRGVQLATVVGPPGEEIFTDKYGRVKVQFHWDREGKNDVDSSCWLRVGTFWAGKNWGAIHIPRIGQEVIVDFEEGDVDHPIIIGSVYNADMMPPYTLPDNKTQSGVKSRSSKKGTPENFNEIRFEDKKGSEEVFVHAEKDLRVEVENDEIRTVDRNRTTTIGKSFGIGDDKLTVNHDLTEQINNTQTTTAVRSIEIKCGQSSIKMDPISITIKSPTIKIQADIALEEKAPMITISADAMAVIKGGVVMIN